MSTSKLRKDWGRLSINNQQTFLSALEGTTMVPGSLNISDEIAHALSKAISRSGLSRYEIASKLSELIGKDVSKSTLDSFSAESKTDHQLPAAYLSPLCLILNDFSMLKIIGRSCGCNVLESDESIFAECARLDKQIGKLKADKERLQEIALKIK